MIEQQLRDVMTAHDAEAPDGSRLVVPPRATAARARRGQLAVVLVSAAVIALVIATFSVHSQLFNRSTGTSLTPAPTSASKPPTVAALACPSALPRPKAGSPDLPWVPAKPHNVDGTSRMVPLERPSRVVVCPYIDPRSPAGRSGSAVLSGDLQGVADDLAWTPPAVAGSGQACTAVALPTDGDGYLIGLSYPGGGFVWVSASANHCSGSGNGVFNSPAHLSGFAKRWYQAGHWVAGTAPTCRSLGAGRLGQQKQMVPGSPVSVTACNVDGGKTGPTRPASATVVRQLIAALNASPSTPWQPTCQPTGSTFRDYNLQFAYSQGPPVTISVTSGCTPGVVNGSLQAGGASAILPLINTLLRAP
jgi:hypothetical protein